MTEVSEEENKKRMDLYEKGLSDVEIANNIGVSAQAILSWRHIRNLKPNVYKPCPLSEEEKHIIVNLHNKGMSNQQIAKQIGRSQGPVGSYLRYLNLPPNFSPFYEMGKRTPEKVIDAKNRRFAVSELHSEGFSNAAIARALGVTDSRISTDMMELHLVPNPLSEEEKKLGAEKRIESLRISDEEQIKRLRAFETTESDTEAAGKMGMTHSSFSAWREKMGLESKYDYPGVPTITDEERERRLLAYAENCSDVDAAKSLGITYAAFYAWREDENLKRKKCSYDGE